MTLYNDEIDLRPYLADLIRHWWQIGLVAFLFATAMLLFSLSRPRQYENTATILLTRSRTALSIAQQFPTINEPVDTRSRMDAILTIARSDNIASRTKELVNDQLPAEPMTLADFKSDIQVENTGDAILITVAASDPDLAAEIANLYALEAVTAINQAYSGEQPLSEIQRQLSTAKAEYETAQSNLEAFIGSNEIDLLTSQIGEAKALFSHLTDARQKLIVYYDTRRFVMERLIVEAEALKSQLDGGSTSNAASLGDSLAVLILRARAFGLQTGIEPSEQFNNPPLTFELPVVGLNTPDEPSDNLSTDLNAVVQLAREEKLRAEQALVDLSQGVLGNNEDETIAETAALIRNFETQLEQEQARRTTLTSERDLIWTAFQALAQKEVEILNAAQSENLVTLASPAIPVENPVSRGTIPLTLVAGLIGLLIGVTGVIATRWWHTGNLLNIRNLAEESASPRGS